MHIIPQHFSPLLLPFLPTDITFFPLTVSTATLDLLPTPVDLKRRYQQTTRNRRKMEGEFPLLRAVNRNDAGAVQQTLRNGADVNCVRENADNKYARTTPLLEACHYGYDKIVRILLDAGANARWKNSHDCSPFQNACREGHLSIVNMLLDHDSSLLEIADNFGVTPLCLAIINLRLDTVRFLLDRGANVHATNQDGQTTLMCACHNHANLPNVQLLLAYGVDVEARNRYRKTALHVAAERGYLEIVRELILQHNANMFAMDQNGRTPFDWISHSTNHHVEQFLGICSNKMTQDHGELALHAILGAAEYTFVEWSDFHPPLNPLLQIRLPLGTLTLNHFRILLHSLDADSIRKPDDSGKLPIHIACETNAPLEVLAMLPGLDPATLQIADHSGDLPLHYCCRGNVDYSSVRYLGEQGGIRTLSARDPHGALPLHFLCGSTNPSWQNVQHMIQSFPGSVAARTNAGQYPFGIAACNSSASLNVVYELVRAFPASVATLTYSGKKMQNEEVSAIFLTCRCEERLLRLPFLSES